jgi:hypothetical protein
MLSGMHVRNDSGLILWRWFAHEPVPEPRTFRAADN